MGGGLSGFFVCGSGSAVCGVVCGEVLVVEGCLGEVVYVLERVLRGRLPGSVLRIGFAALMCFSAWVVSVLCLLLGFLGAVVVGVVLVALSSV